MSGSVPSLARYPYHHEMKATLVAAASNLDVSRVEEISKTINLLCRDQPMQSAYGDAVRVVEIKETDDEEISDRKRRVYCTLTRALADFNNNTQYSKIFPPTVFLLA